MAVESSCCQLKIPPDVIAILNSVNAQDYCGPVWSFSKHQSGYCLKLFWKSEQPTITLNKVRPAPSISRRKMRNKQRMEAFLAKKKEAYLNNSSAKPTVGMSSKVDSPTFQHEGTTHAETDCTTESAGLYSKVGSPTSWHDGTTHADTDCTTVTTVPAAESCDRDGIPAVLSPVSSRTRSKVNSISKQPLKDVGLESVSAPLMTVSDSTFSACHLTLALPDSLAGVTKHYADFVRCDEADTATHVKDLMQMQWESIVVPGSKVKVRFKEKVVPAVVVKCNYISKLSFDCLYYYATAKASVQFEVTDYHLCREYQFRDLILV